MSVILLMTVAETSARSGASGRSIFRTAQTNPITNNWPATAIHRNWLNQIAVEVLGSEKEWFLGSKTVFFLCSSVVFSILLRSRDQSFYRPMTGRVLCVEVRLPPG